MNVKKFLISTVSAFVVMFLLAWIGHVFLITELTGPSPMAEIERAEPLVMGIAIAYLVMALLMAYLYPKGIEGDSVFGNGI